jgi:hypothetical protein
MKQEKKSQTRMPCTLHLRVRTNVSAGESVEACLRNVAYWQDQYVAKCKKQGYDVAVPYYG